MFVIVCEHLFDSMRLFRGLPVTGSDGFKQLVPWLSAFESLTFGQQVSLAGNGQSLPLFGSVAILAMIGLSLSD